MGTRFKQMSLVGVAAAVLAVSPAHAVTNLIVNGSFETGDFSGFTHDNLPASYPAAVINYNSNAQYPIGAFGEAVPVNGAATSSPDAAGVHAAYFVSDVSTNEELTQLTLLYPGRYEIGFSAYLPYNGAANAYDATFSGSIIGVNVANFTASQETAGVWATYSGVANVTVAGYYKTAFTYNSYGNPAKDVVIDQVFVTKTNAPATYTIPPTPTAPAPVPEVATWAMMLLGFGAVGSTLRRQRTSVSFI